MVADFPEGSTHKAYLEVKRGGAFRSKLRAYGSKKTLVISFLIAALLYAGALARNKPVADPSNIPHSINLAKAAEHSAVSRQKKSATEKIGILVQIYLNMKIIPFSLNWLVVCLGAGHAVGYLAGFLLGSRVPEFLMLMLLSTALFFFLVFMWNFFPVFVKDFFVLFFVPSRSSSIYDRFDSLESRFVFTRVFRQWQGHEHKWLPVGVVVAVCVMVVAHLYQAKAMQTSVVILKAGAIYLTLPLAIASGLSFLILYEAFRLVGASEAGLTWRESLTVPELVKKLSVYLVGQTMGQVAFLYPVTEFANMQFSEKQQTVELVAQHWRESSRWCHGLEVEYQAPLFPFAIEGNHEQILCFDESYRHSFKLGTKLLASGPGTFLGTTIHHISSPANEIGTMKTPKWD